MSSASNKKQPASADNSANKKMKQSPKSKDPNADPVEIKREADERQKDLEKHKPSKEESQNSKGEPESE